MLLYRDIVKNKKYKKILSYFWLFESYSLNIYKLRVLLNKYL